jgi:biopolymer transport protein ExbD
MAAEVGGGESGGKKGKAKKGRGKKPNPRIDMTPMVDLGFLLLTFFVLTTTMATPKSMPVVMPDKTDSKDEKEQTKVAESKVLILILGEKDRVYYYRAVDPTDKKEKADVKMTSYGKNGVVKAIFEHRQGVAEKWGKEDEAIVLIKPADFSVYKNFVDILDEMNTTHQKKYAVVPVTKAELDLIADYKKNENLED